MLESKCAEKWAKLKPIPEQISLITDPHRFKVVAAGRRCLAKGTLVRTPNGLEAIENLKTGNEVIGYENSKPKATTIKRKFCNGVNTVVPLMHNGKIVLMATKEHKLLTISGDLISVGDVNYFNEVLTVNGSIKLYKGKKINIRTYDIEIDNSTNLYVLGSGIITHNSGKTERAKRFMIKECLSNNGREYFIAAPTYKQVKRIYWKDLRTMIPKQLVKNINQSELSIEFINQTVLTLIGLDVPERIEGTAWSGGITDEIGNIKEGAWESNIYPALSTVDVSRPNYRAWHWMIGVPEGRNHFYDSYLLGKSGKSKEWKSYFWKSSEILTDEDIYQLKETTDAKRFRREYEASFEDVGDTILNEFSQEHNVVSCFDTGGTICIGLDFNINPMSAVVGSIVKDELYIWKEYVLTPSNTRDTMTKINNDYPGRNIDVYPDPTGHARKTSAIGGVTDHTIIKSFGNRVIAPKSTRSVGDNINITNAMFCNANGRRRIFIDPKCENLINCLLGWQYSLSLTGNEPDKKSGLDHLPEALMYLVTSAFKTEYNEPKTIKEFNPQVW